MGKFNAAIPVEEFAMIRGKSDILYSYLVSKSHAQYGKGGKIEYRYLSPISDNMIAREVPITRPTVSKYLREFEEKGYISRKEGLIKLNTLLGFERFELIDTTTLMFLIRQCHGELINVYTFLGANKWGSNKNPHFSQQELVEHSGLSKTNVNASARMRECIEMLKYLRLIDYVKVKSDKEFHREIYKLTVFNVKLEGIDEFEVKQR